MAAAAIVQNPPVPQPIAPPRDCCYYAQLALVVAGIALGALASSTFAIGVSCGIVESLVFFSIVVLASYYTEIHLVTSHHDVFLRTCVSPTLEEIFFRGLIQPLAEMSLAYALPAVTVEIFGATLTLAAIVAITTTALIFGLAHLYNSRPGSNIQAIHAAIGSIALSLLAVRVGLAASIAMHVVHNTATAIVIH
jgi:membrane protease YdiL (CAAX protease family)